MTRFELHDIEQIHAIENQSGLWRAVPYINSLNDSLGPFWSKGKTEEERRQEIEMFEHKAFPIWKPLFDRIGLMGRPVRENDLTEIQAYHKADLAIKKAIQINYGSGITERQKKTQAVFSED